MSTARHVGRILSAWGLPAAVVLATLAIYAQNTAIFQAANHLAYDAAVRLDTQLTRVPARVLLVYADAELEQQPERYWQLLRHLKHAGASGVGVLQLDVRRWKPDQVRRLSRWKGLVLGPATGADSSMLGELTWGSVELPRDRDGVCRRYHGLRSAAGRPSFAAQIVRSSNGVADGIPWGEFGVRFRGDAESLPHVKAEAILQGEITATLVRDRFVLIGRPSQPAMIDLATPVSDGRGMSVLEFHGHALNTLIIRRPISILPTLWQWGLCAGVAVLFSVLARRAGLNGALARCASVWLIQAVCVGLLVWNFQLWVPLGSLTIVEATASLWSLDRRLRFSDGAWQILRRRGFSVSPRYRNPPSWDDGQTTYEFIESMLQQLFPFECIALLLADPWRRRLEPCFCLGEKRDNVPVTQRDLDRPPFVDALRRRVAVRIEGRQSFFRDDASDREYFVPLFHAGRLQGALVVSLSDVTESGLPGLAKQLTELGDELGTWLACCRKLHLAATRRSQWWMRWTLPVEATTFDSLERQLHAINRRLHQADQIMEQSQFGRAVFDLSGKVVAMNATMYRLLDSRNVPVSDPRVLEVVHSLSGRDEDECREMIRRIVIHQQSERIVVTDPTGRQLMRVTVQPVLRPQQFAHDPAAIQLFSVQGIDVEIVPDEQISDFDRVGDRWAERSLVAADPSSELLETHPTRSGR